MSSPMPAAGQAATKPVPAPRKKRKRRGLPINFGNPTVRLLGVLLLLLVGLGLAFAWALSALGPVEQGRRVGLDEVLRRARAGEIRAVTLHDFDHRITGELRAASGPDARFWATYPASDAATPVLIDRLVAGDAALQLDNQRSKHVIEFVTTYILPLVMLANLFALIFVGTRGGGDGLSGLMQFATVGKGRGKSGEDMRVTFADVAGADYALTELQEVRDYLADPERFAALGALPPKGIMMFGPPGCGKTLMAKAVAGEADVPFFSVSGAEFVESLVGVGAARVRDLFRQVRTVAPAIVFIDEIDAVGRRRGGVAGGQEEREQTLNQLLIEMDGFEATEGVVVVGATNRPDILDPALLRPGRFDRQITVEPPDFDGRIEILDLYARRRPLEDGIDLSALARRSPGFTGADLANVVNEAALLCVRRDKTRVGMPELEEAVDRVIHGPKRRGHLMTEEERSRVAFHEAGHAITAALTGGLPDDPRVSIVAHGHTLGRASARVWAERTLLTRTELLDELVRVLGGMAAEELVFGEMTTMCDADVNRATSVAHMMVGRYGMSEALGRLRLLETDGSEFLDAGLIPVEMAGPTELSLLHEESRVLVDDAMARASSMLRRHRGVMDTLVEALLDHEVIEGAALLSVLAPLSAANAPAPPPAANGSRRRAGSPARAPRA